MMTITGYAISSMNDCNFIDIVQFSDTSSISDHIPFGRLLQWFNFIHTKKWVSDNRF